MLKTSLVDRYKKWKVKRKSITPCCGDGQVFIACTYRRELGSGEKVCLIYICQGHEINSASLNLFATFFQVNFIFTVWDVSRVIHI